jgi:hypothetical protein
LPNSVLKEKASDVIQKDTQTQQMRTDAKMCFILEMKQQDKSHIPKSRLLPGLTNVGYKEKLWNIKKEQN